MPDTALAADGCLGQTAAQEVPRPVSGHRTHLYEMQEFGLWLGSLLSHAARELGPQRSMHESTGEELYTELKMANGHAQTDIQRFYDMMKWETLVKGAFRYGFPAALLGLELQTCGCPRMLDQGDAVSLPFQATRGII